MASVPAGARCLRSLHPKSAGWPKNCTRLDGPGTIVVRRLGKIATDCQYCDHDNLGGKPMIERARRRRWTGGAASARVRARRVGVSQLVPHHPGLGEPVPGDRARPSGLRRHRATRRHLVQGPAWVEHLIGLLDTLRVDRFSVVGNSFGGSLSLRLSLLAPDRVERQVLMGGGGAAFTATAELERAWGYQGTTEAEMRTLLTAFVQTQPWSMTMLCGPGMPRRCARGSSRSTRRCSRLHDKR